MYIKLYFFTDVIELKISLISLKEIKRVYLHLFRLIPRDFFLTVYNKTNICN